MSLNPTRSSATDFSQTRNTAATELRESQRSSEERTASPKRAPDSRPSITLRQVEARNSVMAKMLREMGASEEGLIAPALADQLPSALRFAFERYVEDAHFAVGFHKAGAAMGVIGGAGVAVAAIAAAPAIGVVGALVGAVGLLTGAVPTFRRIHQVLNDPYL